ncbi:hypothetical protein GH721_10065 [Kriegella sp. EG-1]|nr:hypothetical protein [Flavobacteriaceae bacterium EG-1]
MLKMAKLKKSPEVRFDGYTEDWQVEVLEDIADIGDGLHGTPNYTESGSIYFINGNNLINGKIHVNNETKKVVLEEQSIADKELNQNTILLSINGTIGNLAFYQGESVMLGKSVAHIKLKVPSKFFIYHYLKSPFIQNYFLANLTGSTIKNLGLKTIRETEIWSPSEEEQILLGTFFENLDSLIQNHKTQLTKLKNLKKAMLVKMFPQEDATVPEIRFKGFDGDWEFSSFEDVFNYHRPDPYIVTSTEYSNDYKTPVLTANKAFVLGYTLEKNTFNQESIIFDDFTLDSKYVDFPFMVKSSALKILTIKEVKKFDLYFSFELLRNTKIEVMGHARHYIAVVQPTKVLAPKLDEQMRISKYLKNLDDLIENHNKQLKKLNNIKKACLSKMFVA